MNSLFFATRMEEGTDALCMVVNTDDLNRTRQELRAVESRFKSMFDSNIIGVAVVRSDMVFEEANDAYLSLIGYDREELRAGSVHAAMLQAPDAPDYKAAVDESLKTRGKFDPQERVYKRKDGSLVPVFRGMARLDGSDRLLIVAIDLSESKRTQAAMEEAKRAAEAANAAKSEFLAHMSHEIRTPLNGVMGMISLIAETELSPEQSSYARAAKDSGKHLLSLINQVLDFSKIGSGHGDLDASEFSLDAVLEGALASVQERALANGQEIIVRIDPGMPSRLIGDPVRLQQVLLNLIGNAVKFAIAGEIRVSVRVKDGDDKTCRLHFEVSDPGPGISPGTIELLFQPFRQGDTSLARKAGGTGLGLAICKELVELMGGSIWVESVPGERCSFQFTARLQRPDHVDSEPQVPENPGRDPVAGMMASGAASFASDWISAPRVLVVDDHPINLTVAAAMLRKLGCRVETVLDPANALSPAASADFDIVFMDCQMPGMDGFEASRRIRSLESLEASGRHVPIVALTAHAVAGVREKCLAEGMDDFIAKPFTREEISGALVRWLGFKRTGGGGGEVARESGRNRSGAGFAKPRRNPDPQSAYAGTVDWSRLDALTDGTPQGAKLVKKLIRLFIDTTRTALDGIQVDIASGRLGMAAKSLHKLKGGSGTLGAVAVSAEVEAMESALETMNDKRKPAIADEDGIAALRLRQERLEKVFAETCLELESRGR